MRDYFKPIAVLAVICLVISLALAVTNAKTAPVIEEAAGRKAEQARKEVLPEADAFTQLTLSGLPASVTAVYRADNGAGCVFMLTAKGYGGDIELICGIDGTGKLTGCAVLSHSETQGLGSRVTLPDFQEQFPGQDSALSGVDAISGATISSRAYIDAVRDAFTAFELAGEAV
ncbi:MAG: FMN-binding protein [Oscillospiraceae bacterium]|nr:FMN-binding protein [Oscillospiraceae bacterium]